MGLELGTDDPRRRKASPGQQRRAAVRVADAIAAEHPHALDDIMPRLAGRELGQDPAIAADLSGLLAALGIEARTNREAP
ncbi:hypothetical protein [Streptomyces sp. BA2]|uniref:hypothetical protein n=1 Tax=Streptomyces sp. BA2 TaxID=436595 RepID=UPI001326D930|nr:hypothetical protein [Streptomyces sp. BA2]MWA08835.1 hypothetical protein [Streptomyces sp. BA2]